MNNEVFEAQVLGEKLSKLNNSQQSIECILSLIVIFYLFHFLCLKIFRCPVYHTAVLHSFCSEIFSLLYSFEPFVFFFYFSFFFFVCVCVCVYCHGRQKQKEKKRKEKQSGDFCHLLVMNVRIHVVPLTILEETGYATSVVIFC